MNASRRTVIVITLHFGKEPHEADKDTVTVRRCQQSAAVNLTQRGSTAIDTV